MSLMSQEHFSRWFSTTFALGELYKLLQVVLSSHRPKAMEMWPKCVQSTSNRIIKPKIPTHIKPYTLPGYNPLRRSSASGLERQKSRDNHEHNEQPSTDVQRSHRCGIGNLGDDCREESHDTVQCYGDTVASGTVSRGENLGGVRIKGSVVDIDANSYQGLVS